jgi:hypothetical protein
VPPRLGLWGATCLANGKSYVMAVTLFWISARRVANHSQTMQPCQVAGGTARQIGAFCCFAKKSTEARRRRHRISSRMSGNTNDLRQSWLKPVPKIHIRQGTGSLAGAFAFCVAPAGTENPLWLLLLEGVARPGSALTHRLWRQRPQKPPGHLWRVSRNMRFMFCCPATGCVAQGVVPSDKPGERPRYRLVRCTACRGVHFVDPTTGEVIVTTTKDRGSEPRRDGQ